MNNITNNLNQLVLETDMASPEHGLQCLVFRTSLQNQEDVKNVSGTLDNLPGMLDWSADLEDWEKVLRIECVELSAETVIRTLHENGVLADEMPV